MSKAAELAALIANVNNGSSLAAKNFIINGAQNVAQRGTSSTGISTSNYYTVDRFKCTIENTAGRLTMEQASDGPDGFANCTKLTCTTADTSIASNEALILNQNIEGQNLQSLKKGTSDAVPVTVSFYVKANASATYTIELKSGDGGTNRMNSHEFSVTTGWTRITKTFVGDTSQPLDDDKNTSIQFNLWLHGGSDYTGGTHTDNVWHTTNNQRVGDSQTSFFDSTSRTFFITGIQMEIGEKATEFEVEPFVTTLQKCQRYYTKFRAFSSYSYYGSGVNSATTTARIFKSFPVEMNHIPVLEQSANNTWNIYPPGQGFTADATINNASTWGSAITCTTGANLTANSGSHCTAANTTTAYFAFESEL